MSEIFLSRGGEMKVVVIWKFMQMLSGHGLTFLLRSPRASFHYLQNFRLPVFALPAKNFLYLLYLITYLQSGWCGFFHTCKTKAQVKLMSYLIDSQLEMKPLGMHIYTV